MSENGYGLLLLRLRLDRGGRVRSLIETGVVLPVLLSRPVPELGNRRSEKEGWDLNLRSLLCGRGRLPRRED